MMFFANNCQSTCYEKPLKMRSFRPKDTFVRKDALNLGAKFECFLTKYG